MIKAGIVGATGFAGIELVRLISCHEAFELAVATSDANKGQTFGEVYPALKHSKELCDFEIKGNDTPLLFECDVVFLAVPHKASLGIAKSFLDRGIVVIDLSADFRLADADVYEKWYETPHTEREILSSRAFGLPELFAEDLKSAYEKRKEGISVLVACAGCYVTASSLAAKPFVESEYFDASMSPVIDAISGYTGAGKNPGDKGLFVHASSNMSAYGISHHRHTPEIEQILGGQKVVFTPHLAPANRGILSTVTMKIRDNMSLNIKELHDLYVQKYKNSQFVKILKLGEFPKTTSVVGTNCCEIGVSVNEEAGVVVAVSAIDNLLKGASGQALQCANIVFGLPENCGLDTFVVGI